MIGLRHGGTWKTKMKWTLTLQGKKHTPCWGRDILLNLTGPPSILETGRRGNDFIPMSCEIAGVMIKIHWVGSLNQHGPCCNVLKRPLQSWSVGCVVGYFKDLPHTSFGSFFLMYRNSFPNTLSLGESWMHVRIMQDFCALTWRGCLSW